MEIIKTTWTSLFYSSGKDEDKVEALVKSADEGIVLLGCGGDLNEWLTGVSKTLKEEDIVKSDNPDELWNGAYEITSTGGRTDLVLPFKSETYFNMGIMAIWRLRFGNCSWISDFKTNYKSHYNG